MIENRHIRFDPSRWGHAFTCVRCGTAESTEGEAPLSAIDAMREKGWGFYYQDESYMPICPGCK